MNNKEEKYAENLIKKSSNFIDKAEKELEKTYPLISNVITFCQQSMELSAKALFKLMGIDFPKKHEIKFEREETKRLLKELLDKDFPKSFYEKDKIPRLFFLTQFWEKFYTLSKYGIDKLNIGPDYLFEKEEAKLALKHANECYKISSGLENAIRVLKLL